MRHNGRPRIAERSGATRLTTLRAVMMAERGRDGVWERTVKLYNYSRERYCFLYPLHTATPGNVVTVGYVFTVTVTRVQMHNAHVGRSNASYFYCGYDAQKATSAPIRSTSFASFFL